MYFLAHQNKILDFYRVLWLQLCDEIQWWWHFHLQSPTHYCALRNELSLLFVCLVNIFNRPSVVKSTYGIEWDIAARLSQPTNTLQEIKKSRNGFDPSKYIWQKSRCYSHFQSYERKKIGSGGYCLGQIFCGEWHYFAFEKFFKLVMAQMYPIWLLSGFIKVLEGAAGLWSPS